METTSNQGHDDTLLTNLDFKDMNVHERTKRAMCDAEVIAVYDSLLVAILDVVYDQQPKRWYSVLSMDAPFDLPYIALYEDSVHLRSLIDDYFNGTIANEPRLNEIIESRYMYMELVKEQ